MMEIKSQRMINNMYAAIAGARSKPNSRGVVGAMEQSNANYVYDLACFAIETQNPIALSELLSIAPNYYYENEAVGKIVDKVIEKEGDSAVGLHLSARREYSIATLKNSDPNLSTEENNELVKNAICKKNLYSGIKNSLQAEIAEMGQIYSGGKRMEEKIAQYDKANAIYDECCSYLNIDTVEKAFAKARNAYLKEAEGAGIEDAMICKANAHIIRDEFNLPVQEKGVLLNTASLFIASKITNSPVLNYYLNRCEFIDKHITNCKYADRLKEISQGFTSEYGTVLSMGNHTSQIYNEPREVADLDDDVMGDSDE